MSKFTVELVPTIESAPALLFEIAALIEKAQLSDSVTPMEVEVVREVVMAPNLTNIWHRGGTSLHANDHCNAGKNRGTSIGLFIDTDRLIQMKRQKHEILCDYCFKMGRRRATIQRHKKEATIAVQ